MRPNSAGVGDLGGEPQDWQVPRRGQAGFQVMGASLCEPGRGLEGGLEC